MSKHKEDAQICLSCKRKECSPEAKTCGWAVMKGKGMSTASLMQDTAGVKDDTGYGHLLEAV